jgi:hypothetical protein
MTEKVKTALNPAGIWPRRIALLESDRATEAQAAEMESEGQGQRNPTPAETGSPTDVHNHTQRKASTAHHPTMKTTSRTWRPARSRRSARSVPPRDTHITHAQSPQRIGIDAQVPNSMPRAEDDVATRAGSPEFHDRPGSGGDTAKRHFFF